jgi:hypothetical protein
MSRRIPAFLSIGALVALTGWALGQSGRSDAKKLVLEPGRFTVAPAGNTAVLLDTFTGQCWILQPAGEGSAAWIPTRRFDTDKEVRMWQEAERARKTAPLPHPTDPVTLPKMPRLESMQYQAARIRAALDAVDVRVKMLDTQRKDIDREKVKLSRDLEELEKQIKSETGGKIRGK